MCTGYSLSLVIYSTYNLSLPFFPLPDVSSVLSYRERPANGTGSNDPQPTVREVSAAVDRAQRLPQTQPGISSVFCILCVVPTPIPHLNNRFRNHASIDRYMHLHRYIYVRKY